MSVRVRVRVGRVGKDEPDGHLVGVRVRLRVRVRVGQGRVSVRVRVRVRLRVRVRVRLGLGLGECTKRRHKRTSLMRDLPES